jgi:hypothetical protein
MSAEDAQIVSPSMKTIKNLLHGLQGQKPVENNTANKATYKLPTRNINLSLNFSRKHLIILPVSKKKLTHG